MDVLVPRTLVEALAMKAERPEAVPIAGGTDVMVEMNFGRLRPPAMLDVSMLAELHELRRDDGQVVLGAGVPYARIIRELADHAPLVQASRTVGSPPIRNRGTVGGNLGTASPAGDALPVLAVYDAEVVIARAGSEPRALAWDAFLTGPKANALAPDELILAARWRVPRGPGSFSKIGVRNAMVIAVASLTLQVDEDLRAVRVALGSVGPTILRAPEAEAFAADALERSGAWDDPQAEIDEATLEGFADRVAAAARPIDDVRGAADYRRHGCAVLARRALSWALAERRPAAGSARVR
ncbi:MAG TPA: FAD binding domain-containing protein [Actinomycetota bacterium]|nr:FAD binding domain-containing protein [Actinomycetota bacterium]